MRYLHWQVWEPCAGQVMPYMMVSKSFSARFICHGQRLLRWKKMRWCLFTKKQAESERLPPTQAALKQAILRAHYQAMIWTNDTVPNPEVPSPQDYGWNLEDDVWVPVMTKEQPAPNVVIQLVKCGCSKSKYNSARCSAHVVKQDSAAQSYLPVTSVRDVKIMSSPPHHSIMKRMKTQEMTRTMLKTLYKLCANRKHNNHYVMCNIPFIIYIVNLSSLWFSLFHCCSLCLHFYAESINVFIPKKITVIIPLLQLSDFSATNSIINGTY